MSALNRRRFLASLGAVAAGGAAGARLPQPSRDGLRPFTRTGHALGTTVSLTVIHADRSAAHESLNAAFAALDGVEEVMSLYRPHSQLARLNRDRALRDPHPDLLTVLLAAETLWRQTDGAFDATVQPLWSLFSKASRAGRSPSDDEIAAARSRVGWQRVEIEPSGIRLRGDGTAITLNGIAQGFAVDKVIETLRSHGVERALIDTGELAGLGRNPDGGAWRVGIQDPRSAKAFAALAELDGRCLATSGDYATTFRADHRDHHIVDPRTGRSPTELAGVSVAAPNGLWADGLSTALCVVGAEQGMKLLSEIPGCDALFIDKDGRVVSTPGFPSVA